MPSTKPTGLRAMPVLGVADVAASIEHYTDKLGFALAGSWGPEDGPPGFAILKFGAITIALDHDPSATPRRDLAAYLYVDDVDALHADFQARGARIARAPEDAFYGCRDFDALDLDGHRLCFGQDLNPGSRGPGL